MYTRTFKISTVEDYTRPRRTRGHECSAGRREGVLLEAVERGAAETALAQSGNERRLVHELRVRHVHEVCAVAHEADGALGEQVPVAESAVQRDAVARDEQLLERTQSNDACVGGSKSCYEL